MLFCFCEKFFNLKKNYCGITNQSNNMFVIGFFLPFFISALFIIRLLKNEEDVTIHKNIPARKYNFLNKEKYLHELFEENSDFYKQLDTLNKHVFIKRIHLFINTSYFIPNEHITLTSEMVCLFSACFVQMTFKMPKKILKFFNYIEIFPDKFYSTNTKNYHIGEVNLDGHLRLSWEAFMYGHKIKEDGIHVGIHEIAHAISIEVIKFEDKFSTLVSNLKPIYIRANNEIKGNITRNSILRNYAFQNMHEYFAVASETYFEIPEKLKNHYPELYNELEAFYNSI